MPSGSPTRRVARVEDRIRTAKATGLRNLPCRGFAENRVWLELSLTAADLLTWAQRLCFTGELGRCEPATFRYRIGGIAARLTRSGRRAASIGSDLSRWRRSRRSGQETSRTVSSAVCRCRASPAP